MKEVSSTMRLVIWLKSFLLIFNGRKLATLLTFQAPLTLVAVFDHLTVLLDAKAIIALQIAIGSAIFN
jgi:hypothetical protein